MNMIPWQILTTFQKKEIFNMILSDELKGCKHKIYAHYEWKRSDVMLSVFVSSKDTIELGINLNTGKRNNFADLINAPDLKVLYRAYFISAFIHCLDNAAISAPQSYFSGLVLLGAINILCRGKKTNVFSPIERKIHEMRTIDVHCAICALMRLAIDCVDKLTEDLRKGLNGIIGELLTYSMLPEIGYQRNKPVYSLLKEIEELWENVRSHRCITKNMPFFLTWKM